MTEEQFVVTRNDKPHGWSEQDAEYYPIKDGLKEVTINLSKKALKAALRKGVRGEQRHCFFAVGVMEEQSSGVIEMVTQKRYSFLRYSAHPHAWVKQANTQEVKDFVQNFDKGAAILFGGGSYPMRLLAVPESDRIGRRKGQSGAKTKNRKPPRKTTRKSRAQVAREFADRGAM